VLARRRRGNWRSQERRGWQRWLREPSIAVAGCAGSVAAVGLVSGDAEELLVSGNRIAGCKASSCGRGPRRGGSDRLCSVGAVAHASVVELWLRKECGRRHVPVGLAGRGRWVSN